MNRFDFLWPTPVMVKDWPIDEAFNERMSTLGRRLWAEHRPKDAKFAFQVERYNIFADHVGDDVLRLGEMIQVGVTEYLAGAYGLKGPHDLAYQGDVIVGNHGYGVPAHTHNTRDLVVLYYAKVDQAEVEHPEMTGGCLRLFDTRGWHKRWPNRHPGFMDDQWSAYEPKTGRMIVFPAFAMHDVAYFDSPGERIAFSTFVDVVTPKSHRPVRFDTIRQR